jgi:hypothetical protein
MVLAVNFGLRAKKSDFEILFKYNNEDYGGMKENGVETYGKNAKMDS